MEQLEQIELVYPGFGLNPFNRFLLAWPTMKAFMEANQAWLDEMPVGTGIWLNSGPAGAGGVSVVAGLDIELMLIEDGVDGDYAVLTLCLTEGSLALSSSLELCYYDQDEGCIDLVLIPFRDVSYMQKQVMGALKDWRLSDVREDALRDFLMHLASKFPSANG